MQQFVTIEESDGETSSYYALIKLIVWHVH